MDHGVVDIGHSSISCGVLELSRINEDTQRVLYQLGSRLYHPARGLPAAFFVFSDVVDGTGTTASDKLSFFVVKNHLGSVEISQSQENPLTGNMIRVYTWAIDHEKFKVWYADERVKKLVRVGTS